MNMDVPVICAYCKQETTPTREHVIPAFLYRFQKELESNVVGWNEVAEKMIGGEQTVRDVCQICNGLKLSLLDDYGKKLLTENCILKQNYDKLSLDFNHNYEFLARWLLKISFNSSRTDNAHAHLFEKFIPFMLDGKNPPAKNEIVIIGSLAAPLLVDELQGDYEVFRGLAGACGRINPFFVRIGYGPNNFKSYTLRIVMFGPLLFSILMFMPGTSAGVASIETKQLLKQLLPEGALLSSKRSRALLKPGKATWVDYYGAQVTRVRAIEALKMR
ncbi:hypothetical protein [Pseudomonas mandelii]|uniref:hypothetical protein n=1 Tax=Pseudomonas mandelii TaxID=75612 RepID=UPI003C754917